MPAGKWVVLRLGHTSTGSVNAPAPASGRGLECDKLSPEGIEANFAGMMAKLTQDVGPAIGKALVATHIDSWENGSQNWTARMREEFQHRRGYDMTSFLPVMTGRVVGSPEISERFLWDLRRTISELVVENYAGRMSQLAHQHGLKFTAEAYGSPCDNLPYAGQADEPMGEFWVGGSAIETCRGMASAAHTYGKPILGAESFTATDSERWTQHPASIKALGDRAFCEGINRFVFHRYALQPWADVRPGMTMGPWGVHYERTADLVGLDSTLARIPGAVPVPAAAGTLRRRSLLLAARSPAAVVSGSSSKRLWLGRVQCRGRTEPHDRPRWPDRAARRYELPPARAAGITHHDCRSAEQDQRPGRGRRHGRGTTPRQVAGPQRLSRVRHDRAAACQ